MGKQFCSGGVDGFWDCCEKLDETITDFMLPVSDRCIQ